MKGKRGPRPEARKKDDNPKPNGKEPTAQEFLCDGKDGIACEFKTRSYEEITEHLSGSGHTGYKQVQSDLFAEPKPITRKLKVALTLDEQHELNAQAAVISMQLVEQREIATLAKERGKALEADQNALVAKLRAQHKLAEVSCEWRCNWAENSKSLHRLDTNEVIETRALTEEDRAAEAKRIEALNHQPEKAEGASA